MNKLKDKIEMTLLPMRIFVKSFKGNTRKLPCYFTLRKKGIFPKKFLKKTFEPNDSFLSNDLFGICKDMWDWKYDLDYITKRHRFSKMFSIMLYISCNVRRHFHKLVRQGFFFTEKSLLHIKGACQFWMIAEEVIKMVDSANV